MTKVNTLTEIWNVYKDGIIKEGKTKPSTNEIGEAPLQKVKEPEVPEVPADPKKKKGKAETIGDVSKFSDEQFDKKVEKTYKEDINNSMKSVFDKLFEEVMGDENPEELDALGIGDEMGGDEGMDEVGEDEVTITLDRETAEKLYDLLGDILGNEEFEGEEPEGEEPEGEDNEYGYEEMEEVEDEDEEEDELDEAVDLKAVPNSSGQGLMKHGNNKPGTVKPKGGKASGKIKKNDDGEGSDVSPESGKKLTKTGSGSNKVASSKTGSTGKSLFD